MKKDTSIKVCDESSDKFNLEGILGELGSFGKYQVLLLVLLGFRDTFLAMCNFHYVFTATEVPYRCVVPECDPLESTFNASWSHFALANHTQACFRMSPLALVHAAHNTTTPPSACSPGHFHTDNIVKCEEIVYNDYNSIVAEFDLGCQPWKRTLIGTVHNLGLMISSVMSGLISDRYGRKVIIVGTPLMVGSIGLLKSFSFNYWMLIVLEFLETALGYGTASMVLSLETVTQSNRVMFSCIWDIMSSFGGAFFGLIAYKIPYWRYMMRAIYTPLLIVVFYIFLVDEGVRWLLAHNKNNEAVRVLHKVAKFNNITLSDKAQKMLTRISDESKSTDKDKESMKSEIIPLSSELRSKTILLRLTLVSACFICSSFVFNGIIINSTNISGDKFINYSALQLVSIPTRIITALTLTRFGRKAPICVAYCLCAVFFISSAFVPKVVWWTSVMFYLAGKMCSSYGMFSVYVVTMELFPTTSRNSLTNIASTLGRLGGVLAPQTPLLEKYVSGLPSIVFGLVALGPAMLSLFLPDTSRKPLPEDVSEAERIDATSTESDAASIPENFSSDVDPNKYSTVFIIDGKLNDPCEMTNTIEAHITKSRL